MMRRGFTPDDLAQLRSAYRLLVGGKHNTTQALELIREKLATGEFGTHVQYLVDFVASADRGIIK